MDSPSVLLEAPLILIVDDDRAMRGLLRVAMEEEGYRVIEIKNGQQCLEEYDRWQPDMVLLDAVMPEMDGFICCQHLRSFKENPYLPILMITALDDQDSIDQAFAAGATDYVTKPIYWSVLSQRVRHLLNASQALKQFNELRFQLERQQQWQQLWRQISQQCPYPLQLKSLLKSTVDQIRTLVKAERVGLYRSDGTLLAEAIQAGYPSIKTLSWETITLFPQYQETYQQGETVIVDLSLQPELPPEAIAPFNQLTIKTTAMMPILQKEEVWGILWIHHCQSSYLWKAWEVEDLSHVGDLLAIASSLRLSP